jgi:sodium-dependent phosphate cotransporter
MGLTDWLRDLGLVGNSNLGYLDYSLSSLSKSLVAILPSNVLTIVIALGALFLSIKFLSNIIFRHLISQSKDRLGRFVFDNPYKSFGWGMVITGGVQSSSITTSLMVPLVASGRVKLANSFPFIMGANIGTTVTALLAAFTKTDAAVSLALVHLIMNMIGVFIFLPFPVLRRIPVKLAYKFGAMTIESRMIGFSYIIFTFFLLPFTLIYINKDTSETQKFVYTISELNHPEQKGMIVLKTNHGNTSGQFSIFNDISDGNKTVPDTSFEASLTEKMFVGFAELTKYRIRDFVGTDSFGTYSLSLIKDSIERTYPIGDMNNLLVFEKKYQNSSLGCFSARFLVNPELNLILEATYYDSQKEAIKTVKLLSVE